MKVLQIGNVGPGSAPHSTENELRKAMEGLGWDVVLQPERGCPWRTLDTDADMVLWTHTHGHAPEETHEPQRVFLGRMHGRGIPVVGYHLDLWWGIARQEQVIEREPFFDVDLLVTADGGHDKEWVNAGVNHLWMPPAVSEYECGGGTPRKRYTSDIAFIGSWQGYHPESVHRHQLVEWLRTNYPTQCAFWPEPGQPAVRGADLRDLMASVKVVVGDSCMVPHLKRYWSDRVPETTGRGAFLLHPEVEGLLDVHPYLMTWEADNWNELYLQIQYYLEADDYRASLAKLAQAHTLEHHTYGVRMLALDRELHEGGLL